MTVANAGTNFLFSLILVVAAVGGFILIGSTLGYWNPGLIGIFLGVGGAGLFILSKLPRFAVVAGVGVIGGLVATVIGPTSALGLKVAVGSAVIAAMVLFWKILAAFAE